MGKVIIELIGELIEITGNPLIDTIVLAFINFISFSISFGLVGFIFDKIGFYDSDIMSDAHWFVRLFVFCSITYIIVKIVQFLRWAFSFQWWVYVILGIVLIGIIILIYYIKHIISKNKAQQVVPIEETPIETVEQVIIENKQEATSTFSQSRYHCPRCHARLVKRHGPYGDFYGCESYGRTGCKYTRKSL